MLESQVVQITIDDHREEKLESEEPEFKIPEEPVKEKVCRKRPMQATTVEVVNTRAMKRKKIDEEIE